jgi:PadR family transcriptional regulator PadR
MLVLQVLSDRAMHGYELVQSITARTAGALEFGEGSIYPILHRLEAAGVLAGKRELAGGRSRVVYRLTPKGRKHLVSTVHSWRDVVAAVERALEGGKRAEPRLA